MDSASAEGDLGMLVAPAERPSELLSGTLRFVGELEAEEVRDGMLRGQKRRQS